MVRNNAAWTNVPAVPNDPSKGNLRDRVLPCRTGERESSGVGRVRHVMMTLKGADPLVNKFPGDWQTTVNTTSSTTSPSTDPNDPKIYQDTTFDHAH